MVAVAEDDDGFRRVEGDAAVGRDRDRVTARVGREHREVDRLPFGRTRLVESRQQEQVVDERLHPRRLLFDPAQDHRELHAVLIGTEPEQLGEALDRRERSPQFV